MSERVETSPALEGGDIAVLHVDDDPDLLELAASYLEREDDRLRVETETDPGAALDRIERMDVDCVVSDYQMPTTDGLEFLDAVREIEPRLPFILFTGKGSEEIASEAVTAGVTDYLQKGAGREQYELLANRITNTVAQYRAAREHRRVHTALETATEGIALLDDDGRHVYVNEAYADLYGWPAAELVGEHWEKLLPDEEVRRFREEDPPAFDGDGSWEGRSRGLRRDGSTFVERLSLSKLADGGHVCVVRDITERVERERALQRERDRVTALFENMAEPISYYEFEGEDPIVKEVNPAFEATFGVTEAEARGRTLDEIVVPVEHADEGRKINERVREGEIVDREVERMAADGRRTFNLLSVPLLPGESGERGFTLYSDITERKERERELQTIRERYESLFETTNDAVAWTEYEGETPYVREANPVFRELFEPEDGDVIDRPLDEVVTDPANEDRHERAVEISRRVKSGEHMSGELKRDTVDGPRTFLWEAIPYVPPGSGEVEHTHAVYTDISARKEYERELEQYRTLVEAVGDPMYMLDADGWITMVNEAVVEQWGYSREEFQEMHARDIMPEEDYERGTDVIRGLLRDDDRAWDSFEMRSLTADGRERINENKIGVLTEDGEYVGTVGVLRDITERKERQRELRRKNEQLEEFTSIVSHDLRNPLNVAQSRLELVRDDCTSDHLDAIERSHDRMKKLIDDLLTLARQGETVSEFEAVDLGSTVRACWRTVGTDDATLVADADATVCADPDRLRQLLENLLRNAVDHGGESVTITVGDLPDRDGFYVADDGSGIPEDERDRVFESGFSTSRDGTGFGLAIVLRIADAHGWEIEATEGVEGGARFEITGVEMAD